LSVRQPWSHLAAPLPSLLAKAILNRMRSRVQTLFYSILGVTAAIVIRLAYWQIVQGPSLQAQARDQYTAKDVWVPKRGAITTADGYPLVVNEPRYTLGVYTPGFKDTPKHLIDSVMPLLTWEIDDPAIATDAAKAEPFLKELKSSTESTMYERLSKGGYAVLASSLTPLVKQNILATGIEGLTFDESFTRAYPEASLSAHLTGFVGKGEVGEPVGYFGLEGYYDRELAGRSRIENQERDGLGNPLLVGDFQLLPGRPGRSLKLHLERSTQYLVEEELKKGLERYGAKSGEVIVMDPTTGAILSMASLPTYDQTKFFRFDTSLYKNPSIANTYEPGSTFKVLVAAAAFNEDVIKEEDHCDICAAPLTIGKYTIKTWDNTYREGATPEDIIVHSDNIGMVWMQQKLGGDKFLQYLKDFGFGQKTGIDLQEEVASPLRNRWGDIDYATASFGQGIAVTSIQMVRAVGALANKGVLMEPHVVDTVLGDTDLSIDPREVRQVVSPDAARRVKDLMVKAVDDGEAQWAKPKGYKIAGKTGTAQIAVAGHYDEEKTIASFVGFAPADNPRFVMLVKLNEPQSSQWGSETAAPLWFSIARKLFLHYNIAPTESE
jgi:stage V sporulation protein D (sporulation-specific penicillin-binding protein)